MLSILDSGNHVSAIPSRASHLRLGGICEIFVHRASLSRRTVLNTVGMGRGGEGRGSSVASFIRHHIRSACDLSSDEHLVYRACTIGASGASVLLPLASAEEGFTCSSPDISIGVIACRSNPCPLPPPPPPSPLHLFLPRFRVRRPVAEVNRSWLGGGG